MKNTTAWFDKREVERKLNVRYDSSHDQLGNNKQEGYRQEV